MTEQTHTAKIVNHSNQAIVVFAGSETGIVIPANSEKGGLDPEVVRAYRDSTLGKHLHSKGKAMFILQEKAAPAPSLGEGEPEFLKLGLKARKDYARSLDDPDKLAKLMEYDLQPSVLKVIEQRLAEVLG